MADLPCRYNDARLERGIAHLIIECDNNVWTSDSGISVCDSTGALKLAVLRIEEARRLVL
jgi:hypothetical protein